MIIVKIQGGLGNQLSEYAYARALSLTYNTPLLLDVSNYNWSDLPEDHPDRKFKRGYGLSQFNIVGEFADPKTVQHFKKYKRHNGKKWWLYNKFIADESRFVEEHQFHFNEALTRSTRLEHGESIYVEGYWLTEKYFSAYSDIIRKELQFKHPAEGKNGELISQIEATNSISLHVRRGNFLIKQYSDFHGVCSLEYYQQAIREITKQVKHPVFYVFSDDPEWVRDNLKLDYPTVFVTHNGPEKDYEDLRLMSACKHHINANSTFSWWGAWLSNNPDKIVIMPDKLVKKHFNMADYAPQGWIQIPTELV